MLLLSIAVGSGCASVGREKARIAYEPEAFRAEIVARVPNITPSLATPPFEVDPATVERAREHVMRAPRGPARVQALVDFLTLPKPEGLGLVYDWSASGNASATLASGRGNCVALASVLVGLARGLDWPVFYAEARTRRPETKEFEEVRAVSDHMAVLIAAKTVKMMVDFAGSLDQIYSVEVIDDLTAYAHIVNNVAAQRVMNAETTAAAEDWRRAIAGFELATLIEPELGRAWNNMGIAYTKLGDYEAARAAYQRALELDTAFGSAERNLSMMETRAEGAPQLMQAPRVGE